MSPLAAKCLITFRATDPMILNLLTSTEIVTSLILGTSFSISLRREGVTWISRLSLSFIFPLDHFFFYPFREAAAALAIASFDFF